MKQMIKKILTQIELNHQRSLLKSLEEKGTKRHELDNLQLVYVQNYIPFLQEKLNEPKAHTTYQLPDNFKLTNLKIKVGRTRYISIGYFVLSVKGNKRYSRLFKSFFSKDDPLPHWTF